MKNIKRFACQLLMLFLANASNAQEVQELGNRISAMDASADAVIKKEAQFLSSLIYDAKPTLYGQDGKIVPVGEGAPVRLISDVSSIQQLYVFDPLYNDVELLCIKIGTGEDLNSVLKFSDLSGFAKLKYICFQCAFQLCPDQPGNLVCEAGKISVMIQGVDGSGVNVLYSINIDN